MKSENKENKENKEKQKSKQLSVSDVKVVDNESEEPIFELDVSQVRKIRQNKPVGVKAHIVTN